MVFKEDIKRYREYLTAQVNKRPAIRVRLNTEATPELVCAEAPDAVVLALGADQVHPPIPGCRWPNVMHAFDLYGNEDKLGGHVVLVGGGFVGCEATVHLQSMGKRVDVVEMADRLMAEADALDDERFFTQYYMTHEFDINNRSFVGVPRPTGSVCI